MPEHDPDDEFPSRDDALDRILDLSQDGDTIECVLEAGQDGLYWYYITILSRTYEGNRFLNERYVQLVKPGIDRDDTFKTNGINRRDSDGLPSMLSRAYQSVKNRRDTGTAGLVQFQTEDGGVETVENDG